MTPERVLELQDATPFLPFELVLADGRALPVPHPDFLSVQADEEMIRLHDESAKTVEIIDLLHVISLRHLAI